MMVLEITATTARAIRDAAEELGKNAAIKEAQTANGAIRSSFANTVDEMAVLHCAACNWLTDFADLPHLQSFTLDPMPWSAQQLRVIECAIRDTRGHINSQADLAAWRRQFRHEFDAIRPFLTV